MCGPTLLWQQFVRRLQLHTTKQEGACAQLIGRQQMSLGNWVSHFFSLLFHSVSYSELKPKKQTKKKNQLHCNLNMPVRSIIYLVKNKNTIKKVNDILTQALLLVEIYSVCIKQKYVQDICRENFVTNSYTQMHLITKAEKIYFLAARGQYACTQKAQSENFLYSKVGISLFPK